MKDNVIDLNAAREMRATKTLEFDTEVFEKLLRERVLPTPSTSGALALAPVYDPLYLRQGDIVSIPLLFGDVHAYRMVSYIDVNRRLALTTAEYCEEMSSTSVYDENSYPIGEFLQSSNSDTEYYSVFAIDSTVVIEGNPYTGDTIVPIEDVNPDEIYYLTTNKDKAHRYLPEKAKPRISYFKEDTYQFEIQTTSSDFLVGSPVFTTAGFIGFISKTKSSTSAIVDVYHNKLGRITR